MADIAVSKQNPRRRRQVGGDKPTDKERDYLEVIYYLAQRDDPVIAADLARWLEVQPPTVSHAIQQLRDKGYIRRDQRGAISLTAEGFELAEDIVRRHRILERFLLDIMNMPWYLLHEEAVRLEHALSPALEERIYELVGSATTCPHGNPIPGAGATDEGTVRLDTVNPGTLFTIHRVVEEAEENIDLLRYFQTNELVPGSQFFIPDASQSYGITLRRCNHDITLSMEIAQYLWGVCIPIE